jgi:GAF domain-containing protein
VVREHILGELMLGSTTTDHFSGYDLQVITTAAGQLAATIESTSLLQQTDESLRLRIEQLTAIARVSRELGASLDSEYLLQVIHDESLRVTHADCGSILLLDWREGVAEPQVKLAVGCPLDGGLTPLDRQVFASSQALVIDDYPAAGEDPPHADVRSGLIVPISQGGRVVGVIDLHSTRPAFFDRSARETLEVFAAHAGLAIQNAQRFQENASAERSAGAETFPVYPCQLFPSPGPAA